LIIKEVGRYAGWMQVLGPSGQADLRSLLELVSLGLEKGAHVRIRVSGPDEQAFCSRFVELFETHFDFPPIPAKAQARSVKVLLSHG
jgi:phosphocarrier protein HPr